MFYLTQLLRIFFKRPLASFGLVVSTVFCSVLLSVNGQQLTSHLGIVEHQPTADFFHALVDGRQNHSRISRNLLELPMVVGVDLLSREDIASEVNQILGNLSTTLGASALNLDYTGLKVYLDPTTSESSRELVRDYLVRLAGESNITLGALVRSVQTQAAFSVKYIDYALYIVALFFWAMMMRLFISELAKQSYLIEQFQRRDRVALKIYLAYFFASAVVLLSVAALNNNITTLTFGGLFILGLPFAFLTKRLQWQG
jgi:hypothetical protein